MQYIVGLTGLIGSGKSVVSQIFMNLGVPVIDTDIIAHQLTKCGGAALKPIIEMFGVEFIDQEGGLNRNKMRELVFTDLSARHNLEQVLHPLIYVESLYQLSALSRLGLSSQNSYVILVVPLLFKSLKYLSLIHKSIYIDCEEDTLISRVVKRNCITEQEVRQILNSQMPVGLQLSLCDDVLYNNNGITQLSNQVSLLHERYQQWYAVK